MKFVQPLKKSNHIYSFGFVFVVRLFHLPLRCWKCLPDAPVKAGIRTKPQRPRWTGIKGLFISSLLLFNFEIYGEGFSCWQSFQKEDTDALSAGNKFSEQLIEGNYLVNYLRNKYPIILNAEQEKELIIKYNTTNDSEVLEQILSSIILSIWKTVKKVLFRSFHYDPSLADDLLQEAVMNIKSSLRNYDTGRPERFMTYFGKSLEPFLIKSLYRQRSAVRIPKDSNGKLPISIHAQSEGGIALEDSLTDPKAISAEQQINRDEKIARLHRDIKIILPLLKTELEYQILQGLLSDFNEDDWNQLQEKHSITKNQLRTKQNKILRALRNKLDPSEF